MKTIPIFVFLSLACCVSVTYSCASSSNSSKKLNCLNEDSTNLQQHSSNGEAEALVAWNRLMDTFRYSRTASDSIEYPDYYGGSYIEDGKLIVYIVKGNNEKTPQLLNSAPFSIRFVKASMHFIF